MGWNLAWLSYNAFVKNMGHQGLTLLHIWRELNPPHFSQLCVYHHSDTCKSNTLGVATKVVPYQFEETGPPKQLTCLKKEQTILVIKLDE